MLVFAFFKFLNPNFSLNLGVQDQRTKKTTKIGFFGIKQIKIELPENKQHKPSSLSRFWAHFDYFRVLFATNRQRHRCQFSEADAHHFGLFA